MTSTAPSLTSTAPSLTRTVFRAQGFTCPSCVTTIEKQVSRLPGVHDVTVRFASGRVEVEYDTTLTSADDVVAAIGRAGYPATPSAF